jgi:NAD(P)-dependent dehydrogenase (short-subunit alcohol dehydrogenase family)
MSVLREQLLKGRRIALGGGAGDPLASRLRVLGADVAAIPADAELDEEAARAWVDARSPLHALIHDAEPAFRKRGLQPALETAWIATRAVAARALIPSGAGGKVVLLCPRPGLGRHVDGARAALENLARTLSVEWARHSVTAVAIAPGSATSAEELATFACFVVSRGGDYLSGCRLEMDVVPVTASRAG